MTSVAEYEDMEIESYRTVRSAFPARTTTTTTTATTTAVTDHSQVEVAASSHACADSLSTSGTQTAERKDSTYYSAREAAKTDPSYRLDFAQLDLEDPNGLVLTYDISGESDVLVWPMMRVLSHTPARVKKSPLYDLPIPLQRALEHEQLLCTTESWGGKSLSHPNLYYLVKENLPWTMLNLGPRMRASAIKPLIVPSSTSSSTNSKRRKNGSSSTPQASASAMMISTSISGKTKKRIAREETFASPPPPVVEQVDLASVNGTYVPVYAIEAASEFMPERIWMDEELRERARSAKEQEMVAGSRMTVEIGSRKLRALREREPDFKLFPATGMELDWYVKVCEYGRTVILRYEPLSPPPKSTKKYAGRGGKVRSAKWVSVNTPGETPAGNGNGNHDDDVRRRYESYCSEVWKSMRVAYSMLKEVQAKFDRQKALDREEEIELQCRLVAEEEEEEGDKAAEGGSNHHHQLLLDENEKKRQMIRLEQSQLRTRERAIRLAEERAKLPILEMGDTITFHAGLQLIVGRSQNQMMGGSYFQPEIVTRVRDFSQQQQRMDGDDDDDGEKEKKEKRNGTRRACVFGEKGVIDFDENRMQLMTHRITAEDEVFTVSDLIERGYCVEFKITKPGEEVWGVLDRYAQKMKRISDNARSAARSAMWLKEDGDTDEDDDDDNDDNEDDDDLIDD